MLARGRRRSCLTARRSLALACAGLLTGCSAILGINAGQALDDGGESSPLDATTGPSPDGADTTGDTGVGAPGDGGQDFEPEAGSTTEAGCVPDQGWCDQHCGDGGDNCGLPRSCPSACPAGYVCGADSTCACQVEADWCTGRCGATTDNCGNPIQCPACEAGACVEEPASQACGARQCGQVTDNCGAKVNCGLLGLDLCGDLGAVCLDDGGCCVPNSGAACGNQCGTTVTDNCGRSVQCSASCGSKRVCYQGACCTPTDACGAACGVDRVNDCGQTVHCGACPEAGPPDAATPDAEAPEAGPADASVPDAQGTSEAGTPADAASPADAGPDSQSDETEAGSGGAVDAASE